MAYKRISRSRKRELEKPDEFITFTSRLLNVLAENRRKLVTTGTIAAVLVFFALGVHFYLAQSEKKAHVLLENTMTRYQELSDKPFVESGYEALKADFQKILDKYPKTKAAKAARVMMADVCYASGDYGTAILLYERALKDFKEKPYYRYLILTSLAYAHEQVREYQRAVSYLEKIQALPDLDLKEAALFNLSRLYVKLNQHDKQNKVRDEILEKYPDSVYADMIRENI